jgi:predicted Zn-dependent protease
MPSTWARSKAMAIDGYFFDGLSSARHEVWLALDSGSQVLLLHRRDGVVERWPFGEIRLIERPVPGYPVRYRRADQDGQRLTSRFDSLALLQPVCLNLRKTPPRERQVARLAAGIGAGVLGLLILLVYSLPRFATEVAATFPPALEDKIGQATDEAVRTFVGEGKPARVCTDPEGQAALDRLVEKLAKAANLPKPPMVEVIDTPMMNAVALPGNRVIIFNGLLAKAPNAEAVAGVLGHEFGHIAYRHPLQSVVRQSGLSLIIGLLAGDIYGASLVGGATLALVNSAYSREDESAADQAALHTLAASGIDSKGLAEFFHMVADEENKGKGGKLPVFIMSHPDPGDREAVIRREGQRGGPAMSDDDWDDLLSICNEDD